MDNALFKHLLGKAGNYFKLPTHCNNCAPMDKKTPKYCFYRVEISCCKTNITTLFSHRAWPDCGKVEPTWERLQNPLLQSLITERVIYTPARGGHWLKVDEAIFDRIEEEKMKELIVRVLLQADQNVASLPDHVLSAIDQYAAFSSEVTPSSMRRILKEIPTGYKSISHKEKLSLLSFVLEDDNFQELVGLELLPVSDGTFKSFTSSDVAVFITSPDHSQELVPGLNDKFLDQNVDERTLGKLKAVAEKGIILLVMGSSNLVH